MSHLVLSRKPLQTILYEIPPSTVARTIELTVIRIGQNTVRLGSKADADVNIVRSELLHGEPKQLLEARNG